jgi:ribosomal protein S18 acetylase RimI-like enzyme
MIEVPHGLSKTVLDAIAALEHRTVTHDGGRLKLEWGTLTNRSADEQNDLLWWDGSQLLGFLGLYCFDGRNAELVGMVDPAARRTGIATALLEAAMVLCRERAYASVLLVVPRHSEAGRVLALQRRAVLDHSEHALVLTEAPTPASGKPSQLDIETRTATVDDAAEVSRLLIAGFGDAPDEAEIARSIAKEWAQTLLIVLDREVVGTMRVTRDGDAGGVYGFAVDPKWQGRGIGREVLRRVCVELLSEGFKQVGLEVATQNEHALGLYTSLGFKMVTTEDYFSLAV